jgi:hypothetical protein
LILWAENRLEFVSFVPSHVIIFLRVGACCFGGVLSMQGTTGEYRPKEFESC